MSRFFWHLADFVSRALEPNERDAVRGDLAESGESAGRALLETLGLVVRRQSALWKTIAPWFLLFALVLPTAGLLSLVARRVADRSATNLWFYLDNGDWYLASSALQHDSILFALRFALEYLRLFGWSWSTGFMLALTSRRSLPSQAFLFAVFTLLAGLLATPLAHVVPMPVSRARDRDIHDAIFTSPFYRFVFPIILQQVIVAAPSLWGMSHAARLSPARPRARAALCFGCFAMLSVLALETGLVRVPVGCVRFLPSIATAIMYSPLAFLAIAVIGGAVARKLSPLTYGSNS